MNSNNWPQESRLPPYVMKNPQHFMQKNNAIHNKTTGSCLSRHTCGSLLFNTLM